MNVIGIKESKKIKLSSIVLLCVIFVFGCGSDKNEKASISNAANNQLKETYDSEQTTETDKTTSMDETTRIDETTQTDEEQQTSESDETLQSTEQTQQETTTKRDDATETTTKPATQNKYPDGVIIDEQQILPVSISDMLKSDVLWKREVVAYQGAGKTATIYSRPLFGIYTTNNVKVIKTINYRDKLTSIGKTGSEELGKSGYYIEMDGNVYWSDYISVGYNYALTGEEVGSVLWTDEDIYLESLDMYIPRLSDFNSIGLLGDRDGASFAGKEGTEAYSTMIQTLEAVKAKMIEKGLLRDFNKNIVQGPYYDGGYNIYFWWDFNDALRNSGDMWLDRNPAGDDGSYYLKVKDVFEEDISLYGVDQAPYNKDIAIMLLSMISSTPEELFDFIYRDIYDTALYGSTTQFIEVGDCAIRFAGEKSSYNSQYGYYTFYYEIKENPTKYESPQVKKTELATTGNNKLKLENLSLSYPMLNYFNSQALEKGASWFGNVNAKGYVELQNKTINNLAMVKTKLLMSEYENEYQKNCFYMSKDQIGFTISENKICWYWSKDKSVPTLMIERVAEQKMYRVTVNTTLHRDKVDGAYDRGAFNREILMIMLSLISSTPEELVNHMYCAICWTSDYRVDNLVSGDSSVVYDEQASQNSSLDYHYVFEIREAK